MILFFPSNAFMAFARSLHIRPRVWRLLPLAAAGLRLLSPFSSLFTLRLSWPATQSFSEVVFFDLLFWPLVVVCLVLSGLSSCFVVVCLLFLVSLLVFLVCFVAVPVVSQLR